MPAGVRGLPSASMLARIFLPTRRQAVSTRSGKHVHLTCHQCNRHLQSSQYRRRQFTPRPGKDQQKQIGQQDADRQDVAKQGPAAACGWYLTSLEQSGLRASTQDRQSEPSNTVGRYFKSFRVQTTKYLWFGSTPMPIPGACRPAMS